MTATTFTVTVPEAVTVHTGTAPSAAIFVPSDACASHGCPGVAPETEAVPDAVAPAIKRPPPIAPVCPERYDAPDVPVICCSP